MPWVRFFLTERDLTKIEVLKRKFKEITRSKTLKACLNHAYNSLKDVNI